LGAGCSQVSKVNLVNPAAPIKSLALRPAVCFYSRMRKEAAIPVRLSTEQRAALNRISAEMQLTPSNLTRVLVKSFITHYDRNNGKVVSPLKLKQ